MPLPLDTTGLSPLSRVNGEVLILTPEALATFGCVYPEEGPFFGKDFAISYTPRLPINSPTISMTLGVDYDFKFELVGFGETPQDKVWGALNIYDQGLDGSLVISYQSLGGNWVIDQTKIRQYLTATQFNSDYQFMALVSDGPLYLPNNPNAPWPLNSISAVLIAQAQLPSVTLVVEFQNLGGDAAVPSSVVIDSIPLPPNAAQENGGQLEIIAAAQGVAGNGIGGPAGGNGILGYLSGLFAKASEVIASIGTIVTRLATPFEVTQNGNWTVSIAEGGNVIGTFIPVALSEIVDSTTTAGVVYTCEAIPGAATSAAVWRIKRTTTATGRVEWAAGSGSFTQVANNRASLTYS